MTTEQHPERPLLDPRDAFAELGRFPFDSTSMEAMLQRIAELAKQVIPGVADASVTLIANDKATTAAHTGRLALDLDETQYGRGYGPCLEAAVGEEIREITDARTETRWPEYARVAVERDCLSSLSAPVPIREGLHGGLNLYAHEAGSFGDDARETAATFASYAAVAVHNMHLYETTRELADNLDIAMRTRAVIEQAKGILMSQRRCDATDAFNLLAAAYSGPTASSATSRRPSSTASPVKTVGRTDHDGLAVWGSGVRVPSAPPVSSRPSSRREGGLSRLWLQFLVVPGGTCPAPPAAVGSGPTLRWQPLAHVIPTRAPRVAVGGRP